MAVEFHCSECQAKLKCPDSRAGCVVACPRCRSMIVTPAVAPVAKALDLDLDVKDDHDADSGSTRRGFDPPAPSSGGHREAPPPRGFGLGTAPKPSSQEWEGAMPAKFCSECGGRMIPGDLGGRICPRCDGVVGYVARKRWRIFWWTLGGVVVAPIFLAGLVGWAAILAALVGELLGY